MATPYIDRAFLEALYGPAFVAAAENDTGASVAVVIASACAEADAYVAQQVALPPVSAAIEQCRGAVARIAACMLYGQATPDALLKEAAAARKFLQAVADGSVALSKPVITDDPATPEDETEDASFGAAPRRTGRLGW